MTVFTASFPTELGQFVPANKILHAKKVNFNTIVEYDAENDLGNGFVFKQYSSAEMLGAIKRAINLYSDQKEWQRLMKRGMKQDFSWQVSADKYVKLYSKLELSKRKKAA